MKKILVVFALFCTLFFAACGGGSSKIDGEDNESDKNTGELGGECYGNGTCNAGLLCNTESNTCVKDPENPNDGSDTSSEQTNNDVDTISGENDDDSHTSSENDNDSDTTQDNSDSQPDSDDGDTMNSDYSDSEIQCNPNPCKNVANSDQTCSTNINDEGYLNVDFPHSCGCNIGYVWDGAACIKKNLPECSPTSSTPCFDHETGFIWSKKTTEKMHWADAVDYCKTLNQENYGGFNDWRLPKIEVLRTLVKNCSSSDGCEGDTEGKYSKFGDIVFLWSSSGGSSEAQGVYFYNAASQSKSVDEIFDARCVRRETTSRNVNCYPLYIENTVYNSVSSITQNYDWDKAQWLPSFITHYDEEESTIQCRFKCPDNNCHKDFYTGLIWSEKAEEKKNHSDASNYCNALEENGLQGWRLPDIAQLGTLLLCFGYEDCKYNSFGDKDIKVWSSDSTASIVPGPGDGDVNIYFASAYMYFDGNSSYAMYTENSDEYDVRCAKCEENYFWDSDSKKCVNPCDANPCEDVENSTHACSATSPNDYYCGCKSGYFWRGSEKECIETSPTLGNICTGQTLCYDTSSSMTCPTSSSADFYGQDAQYATSGSCIPQSFTASSDVVVDNNTGLTWQRNVPETYTECASGTECTFSEAQTYCGNLSLNGLSNWRVPNPLEFLTIVDNSRYNLATNANFTNMPTGSSDFLWTSKEYGGDTSCAIAFTPYYGSYYYGESKTRTYKVLCVSGAELTAATSSDFVTSSDEKTVTDNRTGLMWQKDYVTGKTWQQALKYCEDLSYAGYIDWRLPNKNELASLLDPGKSSAPYSNFPDMPSNWCWSSSSINVDNTSLARLVAFSNGHLFADYKTNTYSVRCVR